MRVILLVPCMFAAVAQVALAVSASGQCADDETSLLQLESTLHQSKTVEVYGHAQKDSCDEELLEVKGSDKKMPARGFITCCNISIPEEQMIKSMKNYMKKGGRLLDTAPDYGYEKAVGKAVRDSGIDREKLWLSSKIDTDGWRGFMGAPKDWAGKQIDQTLANMG